MNVHVQRTRLDESSGRIEEAASQANQARSLLGQRTRQLLLEYPPHVLVQERLSPAVPCSCLGQPGLAIAGCLEQCPCCRSIEPRICRVRQAEVTRRLARVFLYECARHPTSVCAALIRTAQ